MAVFDVKQHLPVREIPFPPAKNDLGETSPLETILLGNGITRLKCFQSKRLTADPSEKRVSSIERRESGGEAVGINLFCPSVFCLSINVHLVYLLTYIL